MNFLSILKAVNDPLFMWQAKLSPPQEAFHKSQHRKRLFRAANKVGKTAAGAAEAWWYLLGNHPYRPSKKGTTGIVLCPDFSSGWSTISECMRELEPANVLDSSCKFIEGEGYTYRGAKKIRIKDELGGAILLGRGCEQSTLTLEGLRAQWAWVDEPPKRAHWDALRARIAMDRGPLWVTLTPIGRPVEWLRNTICGDGSKPATEQDWFEIVAELSHENAPHRTMESILSQIAETPEWERAQRILASWEGVSGGRRIPGFTDMNIITTGELPEASALGLGFDHGEKPGSAVCVLVAWDGDRLWALDEWQSKEMTSLQEEAQEILTMLDNWGIKLNNISVARGDINSAGIAASGNTVNDLLSKEFIKLSGHDFRIEKPRKTRGSIMARSVVLSSAFKDNKAVVLPNCGSLVKSLRYWEGKDDDLKHILDAFGYIAMDYLDQDNLGSGKLVLK